ncbi:glycosyltransferase family 4 protein [candidate division WOR-3 bacterium]|nr:glycosyltransferase family 4 protein [candidate division WOR-3 bacterium]
MILQSDFPPDIRVEKEARTLLEDGHTIDLLCNNYSGLAMEDTFYGIRVHRLKNIPFGKIINIPLFLNPVWLWRIYSLIISIKPNVIHIHDLPLFLAGAFLGKIFGIPTIFDMHENYPAMLKATKSMVTIKSPYLAKIIEGIAVRIANYIIVVVEEQKERLVSLGVPEKKIVIVSNTVDLKYFRTLPIERKIEAKIRETFDFIITYTGGFPQRGLTELFKAISLASRELFGICLLLVGDGEKRTEEAKKLAKKIGITERIVFTGWVNFDRIPSYINASDICIIPYLSNEHTDTTIPHKLFQYMALSKPIIVNDAKPVARIIRKCNCGIVVNSGDYGGMARAIITLSDKKLALELGKNGRSFVERIYNWENTSKELLRLYNNLS